MGCKAEERRLPHHIEVDGERVRLGSQQVDTLSSGLTLAPQLYERLSAAHRSGAQIELGGLSPLTVSFAQDVECSRFLSVIGTVAFAGYRHQRILHSNQQSEIDYAVDAQSREARVLVDLDADQLIVRSNPCYAPVDSVPLEGLPAAAAEIAAAAGPEAAIVFEPRCGVTIRSSQVLSVWQRLLEATALRGRVITMRVPSVCRAHQARVDQLGLGKPSSGTEDPSPADDSFTPAPLPASFRGTARITELLVDGSDLSEQDARVAVERLLPRLLGCYAAGLSRSPGMAGTLTVRLAIGSAGGVIDRPRGGGTFADIGAVTCMSRTFATLTVPASPRPITTLKAELTFAPG